MSFRGRLLLFFMIIVIVPMVAVALVLFDITSDSENGKADAAIAQGMRTASAIYETDRQRARPELSAVATDGALAGALERGSATAVQTRLRQLIGAHPSIRAATAYGTTRRPLASAGATDAVAFAAAAPSTPKARNLGLVLVSVTSGGSFAQQVHAVTGFEVRLVRPNRLLASTIAGAPGTSAKR